MFRSGNYIFDVNTEEGELEHEEKIRNKCDFLGIGRNEIEIIDVNGAYYALLKKEAIEKIRNKFPKFAEFEKNPKYRYFRFEYAMFSFSHLESNRDCDDTIWNCPIDINVVIIK